MKKGKRVLSLFLAVAMVITGVNLGGLTSVKAAEVKSEKYYLETKGVFYGHKSDNTDNIRKGTDEGQITLKTVGGITISKSNTTGNASQAPFTGESASGETDECGGQRNGCIAFDLSQTSMDLTNLKSAQISMKITDVSNSGSSNQWFRAALYETANNVSVNAEDESTYAALSYTKDSPIWSKEKISGSNASGTVNKGGTIHFDVKDAFKAAYEKGDRNIVYRVQLPRAGFQFDTIRLTIDATTATKTTIKYVDETGAEFDSKQVDVYAGSQYTYDIPEDEKIIIKESECAYVYDGAESTPITVTSDTAQNVITLTYSKKVPISVQNPSPIYAIEGNEPILPKQLTAQTDMKGLTIPVNVTWNKPAEWQVGDNTVTGTAAGIKGDAAKVTAKVHVYECDEAIDEEITADSKNSTSAIRKLSRKYKGKIITEFDITPTKLDKDDCAFIYFDCDYDNGGKVTDIWGQGGAMLHFKKSQAYFNVRLGDGTGGTATNDPNLAAGETGEAKYDATSTYHVRVEMDSSARPGNYRVYVTDPDGNVNEVGTKAEGAGFRKYNDGIIESYYAGRYGEFKVTNHKIFWQSGYAIAQADCYIPGENGTLIKLDTVKSITSKELPGSTKTIDTTLFTPKSVNGKVYLYDETKSGWVTKESDPVTTVGTGTTMPAAGETAYFKAVYEEVQPTEVAETEPFKDIYTLAGQEPILPMVKVNYEGVDDPILTDFNWNTDEFDFNTETEDGAPLELTGTLTEDIEVSVKVHVKHAYKLAEYKFESGAEAKDSTGNHADADLHGVTTTNIAGVDSGSNGVKLTGGNNGTSYVQLPDDLLQVTAADRTNKITQDDFTVSMFINRESNGDSFAMILHATEVNQSDPKGHLGFINKDSLTDMEYRIGAVTKANLRPKDEGGNDIKTPIGQWTHVAIVTNGSKDTARLYLNGVLVGTVTGIVKPSQLPAQNNYLGRASWKDSDYKATFDDFVVYNGLLTEKDIQDTANERLCKYPVKDVYDSLELSLVGEGTLDKDNVTEDVKLNLPTTMNDSAGRAVKITWESDNNKVIKTDGTVIQPSKGRPAAEVILKANIQYGSYTETKTFEKLTVPAGNKISFVEFDEKLAEAEAKYKEVSRDKMVYVESTIKALNDKITDATTVRTTVDEINGDPQVVDNMTEALQEAMDGVQAKSLAEVGSLAAWYQLDNSTEKVKDKSRNKKDGTAASTVTFGRENGATFSGGAALANCISLPTDIEIGEQMTFTFWAKDGRGGKSNAFGIGSGDQFSGGAANSKAAHFFYVNTYDSDSKQLVASMNPSYWSGAVNISTPAAAKDTWHHVACVLSGTKLTLYVNGRRIETKDVGHTVKEMWDSDPATRHIYIGNCAFGKNPNNKDADYKGSIRDFRIYNAPLAQAQVQEVYEYFKVPELRYAKDDLIKAMGGTLEADGTVSLDVTNVTTRRGKITLPETSYGSARVTWKSSDDEVINADTKEVTIPGIDEAAKAADLTATIKVGEGDSLVEDTIVFKCNVYYTTNIPTDDLQRAVNNVTAEIENLQQDDYTERSWIALQAALTEAEEQIKNHTSVEGVEDAEIALWAAWNGLVDISALRDKLNTIYELLEDLDENDYTEESWDALQALVTAAEDVLADEGEDAVTQNDVGEAAGNLPDDLSDLVECGDRDDLDAAIEAAEALVPYEEAYDETTWQTFTAALQNAKEEQAKRVEDYSEAADELNDAIEGLEIKADHRLEGELKEELEAELAAARAEALTSDNYEPETWDVYQKALKAFETVLGKEKVTKDEAEAAAKALADARAGLKPVADQIPGADEIQKLTDAYEAAVKASEGMQPGDYTEESWQKYQNALAAMKKISDRLDQEDNNVTKDEIDAVIAALSAAEDGLTSASQTVDKTALNTAIQDASKLAENNYTAATWKDFQKALKAAKAVSAKADATKKEVEDALAALNAKRGALKKVVKVSKITITADYKNLAVGKKATLKAAITPSNATNKEVDWSVDKNAQKGKYASINSKGALTTKSKAAGKTITVTATAKDGSGTKNTIKIKVMKGGVKSISLKASSKKVKVKKKLTIKATVKTTTKKTKDANTKLTWKSSNTKVATVNSKGVVTGKKAGKVTITATSTDGTKKSKKIKITVTKK